MSKKLLAEPLGHRLLGIFTALSPFYVTLHGCNLLDNADGIGSTLLDNAGVDCPEQPHDKGSSLYEYSTIRCKNNLESSTEPSQF